MMQQFPNSIQSKYEIHDFKNGISVLKNSYPMEWNDLVELLENFKLYKSDILQQGGRKSPIAERLDSFLYSRDWKEKKFKTEIAIDDNRKEIPTHSIDCFRNGVAIEVEWNNKDPFFDRDLNNFRLLYDMDAIAVGVIITRASELQRVFNDLGKGTSYGSSTTHMSKLLPRIYGKGAGGCPIIVLGITEKLYTEEMPV